MTVFTPPRVGRAARTVDYTPRACDTVEAVVSRRPKDPRMDAMVWLLRFGADRTLEEVASDVGITREEVRTALQRSRARIATAHRALVKSADPGLRRLMAAGAVHAWPAYDGTLAEIDGDRAIAAPRSLRRR
jgi:hypothetical protein